MQSRFLFFHGFDKAQEVGQDTAVILRAFWFALHKGARRPVDGKHDVDTDIFQQAAAFPDVNMGDIGQSTSCGSERIPAIVIEPDARSRGAAPQPQQDVRIVPLPPQEAIRRRRPFR